MPTAKNTTQATLTVRATVRNASALAAKKRWTSKRVPTKFKTTDEKAATKVKDYRTMQFLDWFVKEQGEEEKNADDMVKKFSLYGSDPKGLYALNEELSGRAYSAPSLVLD